MAIGGISKGRYKGKRKRQVHRQERQKGQRKPRSISTRKLQFTVDRKRKRKGWMRNALTGSEQDKEKDMSYVTSVVNQDAQSTSVEFQSTTPMMVHKEVYRALTQHNSGTNNHTIMIHTGGTMANHQRNSYRQQHMQDKHL